MPDTGPQYQHGRGRVVKLHILSAAILARERGRDDRAVHLERRLHHAERLRAACRPSEIRGVQERAAEGKVAEDSAAELPPDDAEGGGNA